MNIKDHAINALIGKSSLQSSLRKVLDDEVESNEAKAGFIASAVSDFKQAAEGMLADGCTLFTSKQVNNVINDISRITREKTGYSITCKSRKTHEYVPSIPKTRKPTSPSKSHTKSPNEYEIAINVMAKAPGACLAFLIEEHGAAAVLTMMKQRLAELKQLKGEQHV